MSGETWTVVLILAAFAIGIMILSDVSDSRRRWRAWQRQWRYIQRPKVAKRKGGKHTP